jgi:hypothetical protein
MEKNPFSDPRMRHVFSPMKLVAALLVVATTLSFFFLFAFVGQTGTASSASLQGQARAASLYSTPYYTPLAVHIISPPSGTTIAINTPLSLDVLITTYGPNETVAKVDFYYTSSNCSFSAFMGSTQTVNSSGYYHITWAGRSIPDTGVVTVNAFDTSGNVVSATTGIRVQDAATPTPQASPTAIFTITSPSNGLYTFPAQIPFTVTVLNSTSSGTVSFYAASGGYNGLPTLVGSRTSPPYSITWTPQQPGVYDLWAYASFAGNATYTGEILVQVINPNSTPIPVTIQRPTPTSTPSPPLPPCPTPTLPGGPSAVHYQLESQWPGGFNANVVLTNTGTVPINGWTLVFSFLGDQQITELWNGSYTQTGRQVTITNANYNASIQPGGTVTIGFNGTWVSSNDTNPTLFTFNGTSST